LRPLARPFGRAAVRVAHSRLGSRLSGADRSAPLGFSGHTALPLTEQSVALILPLTFCAAGGSHGGAPVCVARRRPPAVWLRPDESQAHRGRHADRPETLHREG